MKHTELARESSKSKSPSAVWPQFVICIDNAGHEASLELGKVYRQLKPRVKDLKGWVRVIDESGEDYLFPKERFVGVKVSSLARKALARTAPQAV